MNNNTEKYYNSKQGRLLLFILNRLDICAPGSKFEAKYKQVHLGLEKSYRKNMFVHGRGHRKSREQRYYERLKEYIEKLSKYAEKIQICGPARNSYVKTDYDATFMRMKKEYMGNDQKPDFLRHMPYRFLLFSSLQQHIL